MLRWLGCNAFEILRLGAFNGFKGDSRIEGREPSPVRYRQSKQIYIGDLTITLNVIPSHAEAMLDIRALPDEDMTKFFAEIERVIGDPAVKVVPQPPGRPSAPPSRLDTEMFRALEATQRRLYPNAITVPGMVTGSTDLAQLRARGVQAYGVGPRFDEAEFAEHGWHSDVERLSEDSLYGLVQFVWYAVLDVAGSK